MNNNASSGVVLGVFLVIAGGALVLAMLVSGNVVGLLVALGFFALWIFLLTKSLEEHSAEARRLAEQRRRTEWEKSEAGRAYAEQQKIEKKESRRRAEEEWQAQKRLKEEQDARRIWQSYHRSRTMAEIDQMTGIEFERFLVLLLKKMGLADVRTTGVNDQGGDVLYRKGNSRGVVQAKRWRGNVGVSAVQEVLGAMLFYGCDEGMVVTNSHFTRAAVALAKKDQRLTLCARSWLELNVQAYFPHEVPEFNWEEYRRIISGHGMPTINPAAA